MIGYSKSTRHAVSDRRIQERLKKHAELMAKFEAEGFSRNEASRRAYALVMEEKQTEASQ